jgi:putative transposase
MVKFGLFLDEIFQHVQSLATQWMWVYNNERPHSSIGGIPPRKLLEAI